MVIQYLYTLQTKSNLKIRLTRFSRIRDVGLDVSSSSYSCPHLDLLSLFFVIYNENMRKKRGLCVVCWGKLYKKETNIPTNIVK